MVRLSADGNHQVTTQTLSRADFEQEVAARQALIDGAAKGTSRAALWGPVQQDPGCAPSSLWIFDNPGNNPGVWPYNHEICFFAPTPNVNVHVDLTQYVHSCVHAAPLLRCDTWATKLATGAPPYYQSFVASYWAGVDQGQFMGLTDSGQIAGSLFSPYQKVDALPSFVHMYMLDLYHAP